MHVKWFSCIRLFETLWTVIPTKLLSPLDSPGKNTGEGCQFLLQGIILTQDPTRISCIGGRQVLYQWAPSEAPKPEFVSVLLVCSFVLFLNCTLEISYSVIQVSSPLLAALNPEQWCAWRWWEQSITRQTMGSSTAKPEMLLSCYIYGNIHFCQFSIYVIYIVCIITSSNHKYYSQKIAWYLRTTSRQMSTS